MIELNKNDIIHVKKGSGPYFLIRDSKYYIGYKGRYKVIEVKEDGVLATKYPNPDGFSFIYLGPTKKGKSGSIMKSHKIIKIGTDGKIKNRCKQKKTRKNSS